MKGTERTEKRRSKRRVSDRSASRLPTFLTSTLPTFPSTSDTVPTGLRSADRTWGGEGMRWTARARNERRPVHTSYPSPPTARSFRRVVSRPLTTFPSSFRHSVPERTVGEWKGRKEGVEGSRRQDTTRYTED